MVPMKSSVRPNKETFDPQAFLAKVADGQTVIDNSDRQDPSSRKEIPQTRSSISARGRVKLSVVSNAGREAVVAILGPGDFFGEGCLTAGPCGWPRLPRLPTA